MTVLIATHDLDFAYQWAEVISVMVEASCAASWDAAMLHEVLDELKGHGLGVPKVAELRRALVDAGALNAHAPPARSHQALMRQLADAAR
jgi:cobalt/nickel transport system ATP-binding protein